ncbi:hypothetical protein Pelo_5058 [Pelomyxa schiedti]|nr:hypothetical protein Pelo_5058 [Pelomyxa schiedti]
MLGSTKGTSHDYICGSLLSLNTIFLLFLVGTSVLGFSGVKGPFDASDLDIQPVTDFSAACSKGTGCTVLYAVPSKINRSSVLILQVTDIKMGLSGAVEDMTAQHPANQFELNGCTFSNIFCLSGSSDCHDGFLSITSDIALWSDEDYLYGYDTNHECQFIADTLIMPACASELTFDIIFTEGSLGGTAVLSWFDGLHNYNQDQKDGKFYTEFDMNFYLFCYRDDFYGYWDGETCEKCVEGYDMNSNCTRYESNYLLFPTETPAVYHSWGFLVLISACSFFFASLPCYCYSSYKQRKQQDELQPLFTSATAPTEKSFRYIRSLIYISSLSLTALVIVTALSHIALQSTGAGETSLDSMFNMTEPDSETGSDLLELEAYPLKGNATVDLVCVSATNCKVYLNVTSIETPETINIIQPHVPLPASFINSLFTQVIQDVLGEVDAQLAGMGWQISSDLLQYIPNPQLVTSTHMIELSSTVSASGTNKTLNANQHGSYCAVMFISQKAVSDSPNAYLPYIDEALAELAGTTFDDKYIKNPENADDDDDYINVDITNPVLGQVVLDQNIITDISSCGINAQFSFSASLYGHLKAWASRHVMEDIQYCDKDFATTCVYNCQVDPCVEVRDGILYLDTASTSVNCVMTLCVDNLGDCEIVVLDDVDENVGEDVCEIAAEAAVKASDYIEQQIEENLYNIGFPSTYNSEYGITVAWKFPIDPTFSPSQYIAIYATCTVSVEAIDIYPSALLNYTATTSAMPLSFVTMQADGMLLYTDFRVSDAFVTGLSWALGHRNFWQNYYYLHMFDAIYTGALFFESPVVTATAQGILELNSDSMYCWANCTVANMTTPNSTISWIQPIIDKLVWWQNTPEYVLVSSFTAIMIAVLVILAFLLIRPVDVVLEKRMIFVASVLVCSAIATFLAISLIPSFFWIASNLLDIDVSQQNVEEKIFSLLAPITGFAYGGYLGVDLAMFLLASCPSIAMTAVVAEKLSIHLGKFEGREDLVLCSRLLRLMAHLFYPFISVVALVPLFQMTVSLSSWFWLAPLTMWSTLLFGLLLDGLHPSLVSLVVTLGIYTSLYVAPLIFLFSSLWDTLSAMTNPVIMVVEFILWFFLVSLLVILVLYFRTFKTVQAADSGPLSVPREWKRKSEREWIDLEVEVPKLSFRWKVALLTLEGACLCAGIIFTIIWGVEEKTSQWLAAGIVLIAFGIALPAGYVSVRIWNWLVTSRLVRNKFMERIIEWLCNGGTSMGINRFPGVRVFLLLTAVAFFFLSCLEYLNCFQVPVSVQIFQFIQPDSMTIVVPPGGYAALNPALEKATEMAHMYACVFALSSGILITAFLVSCFNNQPSASVLLPELAAILVVIAPIFYVLPQYVRLLELTLPNCGIVFNAVILGLTGFGVGQGMTIYFSSVILPVILAMPPSIIRVSFYIQNDKAYSKACAFTSKVAAVFSILTTIAPAVFIYQLVAEYIFLPLYICFWVLPILVTFINTRPVLRYYLFLLSYFLPLGILILISPLWYTIADMLATSATLYLAFFTDIFLMNVVLSDLFIIYIGVRKQKKEKTELLVID